MHYVLTAKIKFCCNICGYFKTALVNMPLMIHLKKIIQRSRETVGVSELFEIIQEIRYFVLLNFQYFLCWFRITCYHRLHLVEKSIGNGKQPVSRFPSPSGALRTRSCTNHWLINHLLERSPSHEDSRSGHTLRNRGDLRK